MYFDSNDLAGTMDPPASIDLQAGGLRFEVFRKIEGNPGGKRYSKFDWKVLRLHILLGTEISKYFVNNFRTFIVFFVIATLQKFIHKITTYCIKSRSEGTEERKGGESLENCRKFSESCRKIAVWNIGEIVEIP